ncbi:unnamed protein product [Pleuronectes platessa]|uniref:Uncharacterized protein n=1 Tax=Pleuronectes platessa TaxID=8262 RepID=A0A9N7V878_PLEPL|nr:unnamed protein product [Pleuronectes platessa]
MFRWPRDTEPVVFLEASCSSKKPWNPADQKDQKRRRIPSKPVVFLGAASYEDQPQVDITFGAASYEDLPQVDITFGAASYEDLPQVELTSKPAPLVLGEKRKMFRWPRDTEPVVFLEASCSSKKLWNPADQKDQKRRRIPSKPVVFLGAASYEDQPQVDITFGAASYEDLPQVDITFGAASYEDLPQVELTSKPAPLVLGEKRKMFRWPRDTEPVVFLEASCSSKKPWNPADQKDQKRRRIPSKPVVFLGAASYEDQPQVDITFGAASYEDQPQVDITFGAASYEDLPQVELTSKPAPLVLGEKRKMFRWPRDTEPVVSWRLPAPQRSHGTWVEKEPLLNNK